MAKKTPRALSPGEEQFALHCRIYGLTPEREYQFVSDRQWKFDFAWPELRIAVEIEGGTLFGKSRHSRGEGFVADCNKYNRAALEGWRIFRYTTGMVMSAQAIDEVRACLGQLQVDGSEACTKLGGVPN